VTGEGMDEWLRWLEACRDAGAEISAHA
jgi:hypothetical protein